MKFTVHLPITVISPPGEFQGPEAAREMAQALEASGAEAGWVTDHPAPDVDWLLDPRGHDSLDPFAALAFVAAVTERLRLHINVLVLPYRNPLITAKSAVTLDLMSRGRMILGVGGGYQQREFDALGVDFKRRGALMDEALETMDMAWSGEVVVKKGIAFNATGNLPRPAPARRPTIWMGGGSDKAVERAARWADGWCPFFVSEGLRHVDLHKPLTSTAMLKDKLQRLFEMRAEFGREGPFDVCVSSLRPPASQTRAEADRFLNSLGEFRDAGVNWINLGAPHTSRVAYLDHVRWLGEEVIARA